jgi:hypothetical protein
MTAAELLERLQGVRERGPDRWSARCPAHEDKSPSLSILETGDRVLLHCWAGCDVSAICAAVGVELRDLFREGVRRRRNDEVQDELQRRITPREILDAIAHEVAIVAYTAADFIDQREIDPTTWERLALAHRRISWARAAITAPKLPPRALP